MKKTGYFVSGLVGLGLLGGIALASDIELDDKNKDLEVKSSIQVKDDISEQKEMSLAKIDVFEVCKLVKNHVAGKIINVNLENDEGNLVYHLEVIKDNGQNLELIVDAGNGKVLHEQIDKQDKEDEDDDEKENDRA
jgi:uncharacterized membrane protein YkoI